MLSLWLGFNTTQLVKCSSQDYLFCNNNNLTNTDDTNNNDHATKCENSPLEDGYLLSLFFSNPEIQTQAAMRFFGCHVIKLPNCCDNELK